MKRFLSSLLASFPNSPKSGRSLSQQRRARLGVECLEDRYLLSATTLSSLVAPTPPPAAATSQTAMTRPAAAVTQAAPSTTLLDNMTSYAFDTGSIKVATAPGFPDDPHVSNKNYYIQIDQEVMLIDGGSPGEGGPYVYLYIAERGVNGVSQSHQPGAQVTLVDAAKQATLSTPLTASGVNQFLRMNNPPAQVDFGHVYTIQVDNEQMLVQPSAADGNWYIIARDLDGSGAANHNVGAPIQILSEAAQPTLALAAPVSDAGSLWLTNAPAPVDYSWIFKVQIDGEQMLIQASPTSSDWYVLARGVNGTPETPHAQGTPIQFLGQTYHDAGWDFLPNQPNVDITTGPQAVDGPELVLVPGETSKIAEIKVTGYNKQAGNPLEVISPQVTGNQLPNNLDPLPNGVTVFTGHGYQYVPGATIVSQEDPSNILDGDKGYHTIDLLFSALRGAPVGVTEFDAIIHQAGTSDIKLHLYLDVVAPPVTAPAAPTGLAARAVSTSQINVSWNAVPVATGYVVQQKNLATGNWMTIATLGSGSTGFAVTGLSSGTTYSFRVGAFNSANAANPSYPGGYVTATTLPTAPAGLAAKAVSASQINLSWNAATGATGYVVQQKNLTTGNWMTLATLANSKATGFSVTGLKAGTTYSFRVGAFNSANASNPSYPGYVTATTLPPAPAGLAAKVVSASQINLSWNAATGATGYVVQQKNLATGNWMTIATLGSGSTSIAVTGLGAGTTYSFRVGAFNSANAANPSYPSGYVTATTLKPVVADAPLTAGALTPPQAVKGIAFTGVVVFHFTDADPAARASDYTATIHTGDGSTLTSTVNPFKVQVVADPQGGFDVLLSYTYARQLAGATFAVQVKDKGGSSTGASSNTFSVPDTILTAGNLTPPQVAALQTISKTVVFHFTDANPKAAAGNYTATVQAGDGTTLTSSANPQNVQVVADPQGGFDVLLSYTYAAELANATFTVRVSDKGGASTGASTAAFAVAPVPVTIVNGTLGGASVSFILRADGTLWETQGPQMIDTGVQSFQVVNGEVIDLHRDGTLEAMSCNGANKVILEHGAVSFFIENNGNVEGWNTNPNNYYNNYFVTLPTSAGNPVFIQTGVERFAINGAGHAVELTQNGNLYEFTSRVNASRYVLLASGVKSFGIDGAGDVVALTQDGKLYEFTAPASAGSHVLLDSGVQSFAIDAAGLVMDFDTNRNVYEFTAPASAASRTTVGTFGSYWFDDTSSIFYVGTTPVDSAGDAGLYVLVISPNATGTILYQGPNQVISFA